PALTPCPNVTVFHDLQHKRHPEHFRPLDLPAWRFFLALSVRRSRLLIASSTPTKKDLQHYYNVPNERIVVAPLGVEDEFFAIAAERGETDRMFLCVSTLHPHKNLERLIQVFAEFHAKKPEYSLVITGV